MTDDALDALDALRANDRPHSLDADSHQRIEQLMLDAYRNTEPTTANDVTTVTTLPTRPTDRPNAAADRPNGWGRALWIAVAAGLVVFGLVAAQLAGVGERTEPAGDDVVGDYCQEYLDPVADALDLLRVNPNQANVEEVHRLLGRALDQLDRNDPIAVDIGDLTDEHRRIQPSPETSDSLIALAGALGQRVASLTTTSPRCDHQRLAPNVGRSTDLLGRPIVGDPVGD